MPEELYQLIHTHYRSFHMQTITIELRIDFDTTNKKVKEPIMLDAAKGICEMLVTQAMMLRDKRAPQIKLECGDFFATTEEIASWKA